MSIALMRDYAKYPNAIIDTSNCHESWIEMAQMMRSRGIKNYLFHLTLLQPELKGVDPFSPNLTIEQKAKIAQECKENLWYFARVVARLPTKGVKNGSPVRLNRMTLCAWWCIIMNIDVALVAPRQQGKSVGFDIDTGRTVHISGENQDIILITKDGQLRKVNVTRLKAMRDMLPEYLNFTTSLDSDNNEELTCKLLGNRLLTGVAQKSKELADNLGRGMTSGTLRIDEAAYIFNLHISFPVASAAGTAARTQARENGTAYGTGLSTTPGRRDTDHGKFAYGLITGGYFWNEELVDSESRQEAMEVIITNSSGERPIVNGTFSHRQLGRSDSWLKDAIVSTSGSKESILKDYLNHWPSGSESSPIDPSVLSSIKRSEIEPYVRKKEKRLLIMNWYINPKVIEQVMANGKFVMSIDSSNASGRDANGMTIKCIRSLEVIATSNIKIASLIDYGLWIADLLIRYKNITLIIENKSSGQALLDIIADKLIEAGENPFKRIFNRIVQDPERYQKEWTDIKRSGFDKSMYVAYKGLFGFMTTGRLRAFLFDNVLNEATSSVGHLVRDKMLIDQLAGLVEKRGRIDHQEGGHDDLVIAWLMGNYLLRFGKNLWFYGMPRNNVLDGVNSEGASLSKEEIRIQRNDDNIKRQIDALEFKSENAKSTFEKKMIENKIMLLKRKLVNPIEDNTIEKVVTQTGETNKKSLHKAIATAYRKLSWME